MAPRNNTTNKNPPQHKFDPANHHRHEIESRTAAGETCEQIASALRAQGVDITNKTISRRRVEWGLRKRPYSKLLGKKASVPRAKKASGTKTADTNRRKEEIRERTQRGESAEQIAQALEQQGYVLKKGASTVLRLQTQWGLIAPDEDRARGRKRKSKGEAEYQVDEFGNPVLDENGEPVLVEKQPKIRKKDLPKILRKREREANKMQQMQAQTLHYPTNCSFGPKKRVTGATVDGVNGGPIEDEDGTMMIDGDEGSIMPGLDEMGVDQGDLPYPNQQPMHESQLAQAPPQHIGGTPNYPSHGHPQAQQSWLNHSHSAQQNSVSIAAEIMSVEFLVDLATSTLGAAENLKAMLLAYQERRPVAEGALPPSLEDLSTSRRKVREAAAVMHDLAQEPERD